jgi:hypothetical protein
MAYCSVAEIDSEEEVLLAIEYKYKLDKYVYIHELQRANLTTHNPTQTNTTPRNTTQRRVKQSKKLQPQRRERRRSRHPYMPHT